MSTRSPVDVELPTERQTPGTDTQDQWDWTPSVWWFLSNSAAVGQKATSVSVCIGLWCLEAVDQHSKAPGSSFSFIIIPRQMLCVLNFCLALMQVQLETLECFFLFFVQTFIVSFGLMQTVQESKTNNNKETQSVFASSSSSSSCYIAKQNVEQGSRHEPFKDALQCVRASSTVCVQKRCFILSYLIWFKKIFCDTFFNDVTVYKITLFFYQLHLAPLKSPFKKKKVWILCNS